MRARGFIKRAIASQLLLALPAVLAARLALDIRSAPLSRRHIEAEHSACCAQAHDHRLCTLVFNTPWSRAPATPQIAVAVPPEEPAPLVARTRHGGGQIRLALARAPPTPA